MTRRTIAATDPGCGTQSARADRPPERSMDGRGGTDWPVPLYTPDIPSLSSGSRSSRAIPSTVGRPESCAGNELPAADAARMAVLVEMVRAENGSEANAPIFRGAVWRKEEQYLLSRNARNLRRKRTFSCRRQLLQTSARPAPPCPSVMMARFGLRPWEMIPGSPATFVGQRGGVPLRRGRKNVLRRRRIALSPRK